MYFPIIGERLKALRKGQELTQEKLGKLLGCEKGIISKYELGVCNPPCDVLVQLAEVFCVSADYLLGLENQHQLRVTGLTDEQVTHLVFEINQYRKANKYHAER